MRSSDIVTQLAILLPQVTDKFTDNMDVLRITRSGSVLTVECADDHGWEVGNAVAITGAVTRIAISSLTRSGTIGTLVTSSDHDLNSTKLTPYVTISGATEAEFNGTFLVVSFDNRRTIQFSMADAGAVVATGSPVLENGESALRKYDKTYRIESVPSSSSFTVTESHTTMLDPVGTIQARGKPRVSSAASIDRAIQAYTTQNIDKLWVFVVLENVTASKSRDVRSDAIDNLTPSNNYRQQLIQPFSVYVLIPSQASIAASEARDLAEDLFRPLCRCLLASRFDSQLYVGPLGAVQFEAHGIFAYNTAVYAHVYSFQQVVDLYEQDTVGPDLDVAFRDLSWTMVPDVEGSTHQGSLVATIDLDSVPL